MSLHQVSEQDLHAYLDGALPESRQAEVEAYLADNPDEQERLEQYRRLDAQLHRQFDHLLDEPLPPHLLPPHPAADGPQTRSWLPRLAAAVALVSLGTLLGWQLNEGMREAAPPQELVLVRPAANAYRVYAAEVRHPVEVPAEQEEHLVAWLSKRLGARVQVPDLNPAGFALVGGRLLPDADRAAAQFMYENPQGKRLTLYLRQNREQASASAFRYQLADGVGTFYWVDGAFGYALSGELEREQLLRAATLSYRSLNPE